MLGKRRLPPSYTLQVNDVFLYDNKPVYIVAGSPYPCNFWHWRYIRPDGTLSRTYRGYDNQGRFAAYKGYYEVSIRIKLTK